MPIERERKIRFESKGTLHTFLGTIEGLFEEYPDARIRKITYTGSATTTWRDIPHLGGKYQISNNGLVRKIAWEGVSSKGIVKHPTRILKPYRSGYIRLRSSDDKPYKIYKITDLLALVFNK